MSTQRKLRPNVKKALNELRNNPDLQPITEPPFRAVAAVQFGLLSPDHIRRTSVCEIKNSRVINAHAQTVYDERMGPINRDSICATCNEQIRVCPGHFGHIELSMPIIHPMYLKFIVTILNCICLKCSKLKMSREEIDLEIDVLEHDRYIRYIDRLNIIVGKCENVAYCTECTYPYPKIKEIDGQIYKVYDNKKEKDAKKGRIEVDELRDILIKISTDDLKLMGFQPQERRIYKHGKIEEVLQTFRPEWLILECLPVLPPMARPPDNEGDNRSDDDLTTMYTDIIKYTERMKEAGISEMMMSQLAQLTQKHVKGLFDNSDGTVTRSTGKEAKGIRERIHGKGGHVRGKLLGKRVDNSARTVITGDPNLRLDEVGVPEEIAKKLSFPEKVIPRNVHRLQKLLDDGKINSIVRNDSKLIRVAYSKRRGTLKLRYGDLAYRQLQDGDTVVFNRQPTLHRPSMMAHYARILPGKTFRLNLSVTTPYNADFDGDEMQAHIPQDDETVAEVQELMAVNKMIVSSQSNRPIMGVIQDALLGVYLLTFADVVIPRHQFNDCIFSAGESYVRKLTGFFTRAKKYYKNPYVGRVLFSILLPEDYHHRCMNNASKEEPEVVIENGILVSGIIDKKLVGRSHGSIIHRLYKEYGCDRAAEFLSAIQFLVNRWLSYRGFSVGIADYLISDENKAGIETAIQKAYIEVQSIIDSDDAEDLKEFRINNTLNNRGQSLAINGLCPNNRLEVMINSGSKGSKMNIIQIVGHLGQNNVEGRRIQYEMDNGNRTLPCFARGDNHPRTRGFIEHSFFDGLTPSELFFHTKAGREGVISTAVKTSESGYVERKLVKRMEDLTVYTDHTVRNSVNNIVSFSYHDSLDPVHHYNTKGPGFIDVANIMAKLNEEALEDDPETHVSIVQQQRYNELQQHIKEYRETIRILKQKSGTVYKKMLTTARAKLRVFLQERTSLREQGVVS